MGDTRCTLRESNPYPVKDRTLNPARLPNYAKGALWPSRIPRYPRPLRFILVGALTRI